MTPGKIPKSHLQNKSEQSSLNIEKKDKRVKGMSGSVSDTDDERSEFFFFLGKELFWGITQSNATINHIFS